MDLRKRYAAAAVVGALALTGAFAAMPVFAQGAGSVVETSGTAPLITDQVASKADTKIEVQLYALSDCSICGEEHSVIPAEDSDGTVQGSLTLTADDLFGDGSGLQIDLGNVEQTGDSVDPYLPDGSLVTLYGIADGTSTFVFHAQDSDATAEVSVTVADISNDDELLGQVKHYQAVKNVKYLSPTDGQIVDMKYLAPGFPVIQENFMFEGEDGTDDLLNIGDIEYSSSDPSIAEPYAEGYGFKVNGTGTVTLTVTIQDLVGKTTFSNSATVRIVDSSAPSTEFSFVNGEGGAEGSVDISGSGEAIAELVSDGASLKVDEVAEPSGSLAVGVTAIEQQVSKILGVYDISFVDENGEEIAMTSDKGFKMTVRLPIYGDGDAATFDDVRVYHVAGDGTYTPMEAWTENGCICFKTTHLSAFVVAQGDKQAEKPGDEQDPADEQKPEGEQKPADEQKPEGEQKPADEQKPEGEQKPTDEQKPTAADDAEADAETLVQTGDAALLMSGLAAGGSAIAFAGAAIFRRR